MLNLVAAQKQDPTTGGYQLGWTEWACVGYVGVILSLVIALHVYLGRKGVMFFDALEWSHISRGGTKCGPGLMAAYRLLFAAFVFGTDVSMYYRVSTALHTASGGLQVFGTFTIWSWTLIGVYFALASVASLADALGFRPKATGSIFCCAVWVLFEVMFTVALLIWLAVWAVLLPEAYYVYGSDAGMLSFIPFCAHNLNVVFMVTDACLNRLCFASAHLVFVMYYSAAYVVFSWAFFLYNGYFFYFFIDWRQPLALAGYTTLLLFMTAFFFLGRCCLKRKSSSKLLSRHLPVEDGGANRETSEEDEDTEGTGGEEESKDEEMSGYARY